MEGLVRFVTQHLPVHYVTKQIELRYLCLVLVELQALCYRAYVCVRNTFRSCNMS